MKTDQWKIDGICSECRREKYCSKQCKANKYLNKRRMDEAIWSSILPTFSRLNKEVMQNKCEYIGATNFD